MSIQPHTRLMPDVHDIVGDPVVLFADSAGRALAGLQRDVLAGPVSAIRAEQLIAERADLSGFTLAQTISAGGACRLLPTNDGMLAISLARPDDWTLLPALFDGHAIAPGDWHGVATRVRTMNGEALTRTGALLGLAIARADVAMAPPLATHSIVTHGPSLSGNRMRPPRVLDLSALWAGPLCAHLLERMGASVIKVEGQQRPDGARRGNGQFYALLNQHKRCVAIDLGSSADRAMLLRLIDWADIVIESTRPRALLHAGIDAETLVQQRCGLVWIAISAYGRDAGNQQRIGYGDDTAAAAGLCAALYRATGHWGFIEDAIADPLTGIHAAKVAWESWQSGRGGLISLSLRDVAAWSFRQEDEDLALRLTHWYRQNQGIRRRSQVRSRVVEALPRPVGADNDEISSLISVC